MTTKDYVRLARALAAARAEAEGCEEIKGIGNATRQIAVVLEEDNPRFKWCKFLNAAGFGCRL